MLLDFKVQSIPCGVVSSGGFVDGALQRRRAVFGPQDAEPRTRPRVTEDFATQDLVLIGAIVDRHAETEQHYTDETIPSTSASHDSFRNG